MKKRGWPRAMDLGSGPWMGQVNINTNDLTTCFQLKTQSIHTHVLKQCRLSLYVLYPIHIYILYTIYHKLFKKHQRETPNSYSGSILVSKEHLETSAKGHLGDDLGGNGDQGRLEAATTFHHILCVSITMMFYPNVMSSHCIPQTHKIIERVCVS